MNKQDYNKSKQFGRFEEIIEPTLDSYEDSITAGKVGKSDGKNEAESIRKAILSLAHEEDERIIPTKANNVGFSKEQLTKFKGSEQSLNDVSNVNQQSITTPTAPKSFGYQSNPPVPTESLKPSSKIVSHNPVSVVSPRTVNVASEVNLSLSPKKRVAHVPAPVVHQKKQVEPPAVVVATPLLAPSSPVPVISQSVTKSTLLHRIIGTIIKRMTFTDEGIAISNINSRTARFDKHSERRKEEELAVKQVHHNVEMDFSGYFKSDDEKVSVKFSKKRINSVEDDFQDEGITSNDSVACIRRLTIETTSTAFPTSSLLNIVMKKLLLEGKDPEVRVKAYEYLDHFMFLHLGREGIEREQWLVLVLSAMRNLPEMKLFKSFDIGNNHDILACFRFLRDAVALFQARTENDDSTLEGSKMFFEFLVKLLQKDFELWWKHWRKSDSSRAVNYPLIYYLLGGSRSCFVKNLSKTLLKLYSQSLLSNQSQLLPTMRKLVSMSALLISHLDSMDGYIGMYLGDKVTLAKSVGEVLMTSKNMSSDQRYMELSLLQPNWLSLLVSRQLLSQEGGVDVGDSLAGLANLRLESHDQSFSRNVENWSHRLCGLQQAHAIFRANWHSVRSDGGQQQFKVFKHLSRLEDKGVSVQNKMVKMEDVGLRLSKVVESVNAIRDVANNNSVLEEKLGETSALTSLFFKMTFVDNF